MDNRTETIEKSDEVVICQLSDLPSGTMKAIRIDGVEPLAVYNVDGEVHLTSDTCSHAEAVLSDGDLEGDRVVCPAHWAEFDVRTGAALCFPATKPVKVYPVSVVDDQIVANLTIGETESGL